MFRRAEDSHVPARPDELGGGHGSSDEPCPEVGAFEEGIDDLDVLLLDEAGELTGGSKGGEVVGAADGQQVDGTWRRLELGQLRIDGEAEDGDPKTVVREKRGEPEGDDFGASEGFGELVEYEKDVRQIGKSSVRGAR